MPELESRHFPSQHDSPPSDAETEPEVQPVPAEVDTAIHPAAPAGTSSRFGLRLRRTRAAHRATPVRFSGLRQLVKRGGGARRFRRLGGYRSLIAFVLPIPAAAAILFMHTTSDGALWSDPPLALSPQPATLPAIQSPPPAGQSGPPAVQSPPLDVDELPAGPGLPANGSEPLRNPPAVPAGTRDAKPRPIPRTLTGQITGIGGMCADVAGAVEADGTPVQLHPCTGHSAQRWVVGPYGTIRALGRCMDVTSGLTANGTAVQMFSCNGTAAQLWTASAGRLINAGSGRCLDATGMSSADGTRLQIWDCGGNPNQLWTLPPRS